MYIPESHTEPLGQKLSASSVVQANSGTLPPSQNNVQMGEGGTQGGILEVHDMRAERKPELESQGPFDKGLTHLQLSQMTARGPGMKQGPDFSKAYVHIYIYIFFFKCIYVYMYIYIYLFTVYVYIYTYTCVSVFHM